MSSHVAQAVVCNRCLCNIERARSVQMGTFYTRNSAFAASFALVFILPSCQIWTPLTAWRFFSRSPARKRAFDR